MIVDESKFPHTVLQLFRITAKVRLSQFEKILITGSIQTRKCFYRFFRGYKFIIEYFKGKFYLSFY